MTMLTNETIDELVAGQTVATQFLSTLSKHADRTALRWMQVDQTWASLTFAEMADRAARAAAGLRELGVGPGDRVVLMMRNIPEFHWLDLGVLLLGATPVSIYNSSSAEQVQYLVGHCAAKVAIVENESFLEKFLTVRDELPSLECIVTLVAPPVLPEGVFGHDALMTPDPLDIAEAAAIGSPDDLATIIYTSGTTGNPKGGMCANHNITWVFESAMRSYGWARDEMAGKKVVSYLPMAHIAERVVSHYSLLGAGVEVSTCPETSLLTTFLGEVHPNIVFGVPRVWEKLYAGVTAALSADPEKAEKFNEAIAAAQPIRRLASCWHWPSASA